MTLALQAAARAAESLALLLGKGPAARRTALDILAGMSRIHMRLILAADADARRILRAAEATRDLDTVLTIFAYAPRPPGSLRDFPVDDFPAYQQFLVDRGVMGPFMYPRVWLRESLARPGTNHDMKLAAMRLLPPLSLTLTPSVMVCRSGDDAPLLAKMHVTRDDVTRRESLLWRTACLCNQHRIARYLLDTHELTWAEVTTQDAYVLEAACSCGFPEIVRLFTDTPRLRAALCDDSQRLDSLRRLARNNADADIWGDGAPASVEILVLLDTLV